MKIFFDYQIFYLQKYGGISKYFIKLSEYLNKTNNKLSIFAPIHKNSYCESLRHTKVFRGVNFQEYPRFTGRIINLINSKFSNFLLNRSNVDILHLTYYNNTYKLKRKITKILTVYDLIHEKFPAYYNKNSIKSKQEAINFSDHIICISKNTQNDLVDIYNVNKSKTSVIHLGVEKDNLKDKIKLNRPSILYVGDRKRYKNFRNFVKAYSRSNSLSQNLNIICFGGGKFSKDELDYFKILNLNPNNFEQTSGNDELLKIYYRSCEFLIVPSIYEGFGLPVIEAMASGCPVLCSNLGSLPEVANDAAIYFDPTNIESIKTTMENFINKSGEKHNIIRKGYQNIENFTWDKCAKKTLEIYKKLQ